MPPLAHPAADPTAPPVDEAFWRKIPGVTAPKRRGYPRVHANVPVRIADVEGGNIDLKSNDLSLGGLQVGCDEATGRRLSGAGATPPGQSPTYAVTLLLRSGGEKQRVKALARVVHVSPRSGAAGEVAVGFQFRRFEEDGESVVRRFIEFHMRHAEG